MGYLYLTFSYGSGVTRVHGARGQSMEVRSPEFSFFLRKSAQGLKVQCSGIANLKKLAAEK